MDSDVKLIAKSTSAFALDLYGQLATRGQQNLFFSPYSLSVALAMAYAGARGETAAQMAEVLHLDLPPEQVHALFEQLHRAVTTDANKGGFRLNIANRLWAQEGYTIVAEFSRIIKQHYEAEVGQVDFMNRPEDARIAINEWVERRTEEKIRDLIPTGTLDALTRLLLTNAVYFKGNWSLPFDEDLTQPAPFHLSREDEIEVPMMFREASFSYGENESAQLLELPYKFSYLSMVVLLPKELDGLQDVEAALTNDRLDAWMSELRNEEVKVYLPRFKMTDSQTMGQALRAMGMTLCFETTRADFSGMSAEPGFFLGDVLHKAYVNVNEKGTEAAAATAFVTIGSALGAREPVKYEFRADHPFIFLIRDCRTGSILFLGRVANPQA